MPHIYLRFPQSADFEAGFARIRNDFAVPEAFPDEVLHAADEARWNSFSSDRRDARDINFVAIDPAGSTDLDQAYHAQRLGDGFRVSYAIADVSTFVEPGSILDAETHIRGLTMYAPDRRSPLHPPVLSEASASLLAGADRPAVLWTLDLDGDGTLTNTRVERAIVRNRDQLAYTEAQDHIDTGTGSESLMLLREIGMAREALSQARGAISLNIPGQELSGADGKYSLAYDAVLPVEGWNAHISLMTGMAAADLMLEAGVGLVRTLPPPGSDVLASLRMHSAALGVPFPDDMGYGPWVSSLEAGDPSHVALMTQATQGLRGAGYQAFDGERPAQARHAAIAANYTHVTAPLRRLVDRFTSEVALAIAADQRPPGWVLEALPGLPKTMQKAKSRERRYERAILDFAEALVMTNRVGETFDAVVTNINDRGTTVQLINPAVIATIPDTVGELGSVISVKLLGADINKRHLEFGLTRAG